MVTVTLPIRTAGVPQPERLPLPVPDDARAGGFGAVFAMFGSEPPSPDRAVPKLPEAAITTDRLSEDPPPEKTDAPDEEARADAVQEATPIVVPQALLTVVPLAAEEVAIAAALLAGTQPLGGTLPLVEAQPPAPTQLAAQAQTLAPAMAGAIALPTLPESAPSTDSGAISSAPVSVAVQTTPLLAAQPVQGEAAFGDAPVADGPTAETGLFQLADGPGTTTRASALPVGMPAFWAAREAAASVPVVAQDPASTDGAPVTTAPDAPGPVAPKLVEVLPTGDGISSAAEAEVPTLPEARAGAAPLTPLTLALGQSHATPGQTAPHTTPASPAAPAMPPQLPAQIAAAVAARPERPLELRLAPVELGGLSLNLRQDGDILRVVLQADRPETLDLLRRNGDVLLEELRLAGFSGASLSFGDGGGAQDRPSTAALQLAPAADSPPRSAPVPAFASAQTAQGLDLRL